MNANPTPKPAAERFSQFVALLQQESNRGLALVGAALIDEKLSETLLAFFIECSAGANLVRENGPLGSLATRADACLALGLIDDHEYAEIRIIRKVRNEFAHSSSADTSFDSDRIRDLCNNLTTELPTGGEYSGTRFTFFNAVIAMSHRLFYRASLVRRERRVAKEWAARESTRWRSIVDEPPPEDEPVMLLAKRPDPEEKP